jgi:hypothetical protein
MMTMSAACGRSTNIRLINRRFARQFLGAVAPKRGPNEQPLSANPFLHLTGRYISDRSQIDVIEQM